MKSCVTPQLTTWISQISSVVQCIEHLDSQPWVGRLHFDCCQDEEKLEQEVQETMVGWLDEFRGQVITESLGDSPSLAQLPNPSDEHDKPQGEVNAAMLEDRRNLLRMMTTTRINSKTMAFSRGRGRRPCSEEWLER